MSALSDYLASVKAPTPEMAMYVSSLEMVSKVSPETAGRIVHELRDQRTRLKLIASENYSSLSVQAAMGNLMTDKYSEGFPHHRFYAGCENVDAIEDEGVEAAKRLFGAEHAYIQPHSGADANLCAYWAILNTRIEVPALEEMGFDKADLGWALSAVSIAYGISKFVMGTVSDHSNARVFIPLGLVASAVIMTVMGLIPWSVSSLSILFMFCLLFPKVSVFSIARFFPNATGPQDPGTAGVKLPKRERRKLHRLRPKCRFFRQKINIYSHFLEFY